MNDPLSDYLRNDEMPKLSRSQLRENMQYLQSSLIALGLPASGDLFSSDLEEIKKTVDCIYTLLQQRQRDINWKSQMQDRIQKLESEKAMYQQKIEQISEDKNSSFNEMGKAQNKLTQELAKWKKEKEKITVERDDLRKEITKMIGKETKLWHEIKKKEAMSEKMKEQLRKALGEKDLLHQNHIDLVASLKASGSKGGKANESFNELISRGLDDNQNYLLNENQELRSALETIQKELHVLMDERRDFVLQHMSRIPNINLIYVNSNVFQAPFTSVSENVIETFVENIRRFRQFIQLTSNLI